MNRLLARLAPHSRLALRALLRRLGGNGHLVAAAELVDRFGDPGKVRVGHFREARDVLAADAAPPSRERAPRRAPNDRVLVALHQSRPHRQNGYAIRSHHILSSVRAHGIEAVAATRMGFPQDVGVKLDAGVREEWVEGIPYLRIPAGRAIFERASDGEYVEEYARALAGLIEEHDCSVVHGASNYLNGGAATLAGRLTGARSIYEVRGLWYLTRIVKVPSLRDTDEFRYREKMELATMRDADEVVVISEALGGFVREHGIPAERVTVVPNAVDADRFVPEPRDDDLARELGIEGRFVIGFLGSIELYEGLDVLIEATARLLREHANVVLLIVGDGFARKQLEADVRARGLGRSIRILGRVPFEDVHRYYSLFDACPFPRTSHEVTQLVPPLKVLEAMAMRKPVIVSDLPPLLELVEPGETGLGALAGDASSLADALRALYEDASLRDRLAERAREWVVRERSWTRIAERFLPLYRQ